MRIDSVTSEFYHVPPTVRWEDATHVCKDLEFIVTTIVTDSDISGTGYAYTIGTGGSAILALLDDYVAAMLIGQDPMAVVALWDELAKQLHRTGSGGTNTLVLGAVDMALWDIRAKYLDQPLHRLLGGTDEGVRVYGSGIDLFLDTDGLLDHIQYLLDLGFNDIKMKIGHEDPEEDLERINSVRHLIGRERRLFVDANQRWTLAQAVRHIRALESADLLWIEEPLKAEDVANQSQLRQMTGVAVAAGESLYTLPQFGDLLRSDAADILQPDICRVGGITPFLRIAALAQAYHTPVAPHYALEATLPLMGAIPNGLMLEWVRGGTFTEMELLVEPLDISEGYVRPFQAPGHGIRFDRKRLSKYHVTAEDLHGKDLRTAK